MPTSGDLIDIVAGVTGFPAGAVATRFRVVREAGYLATGGKGRSAADHGLQAAMRLLVACLASDDARTADAALRDAFLLRPRSVLRRPVEGRHAIDPPYRHRLTRGFFEGLPIAGSTRTIQLDLLGASSSVGHRVGSDALSRPSSEGLPTARLKAETHFGSVLAVAFEAVRDGTLIAEPRREHFAEGAQPPVAEPAAPRRHAEVALRSRLVDGGWKIAGASLSFGLGGLWSEARAFGPSGRKASARSNPAASDLAQVRTIGLETMERLASFFPSAAGLDA